MNNTESNNGGSLKRMVSLPETQAEMTRAIRLRTGYLPDCPQFEEEDREAIERVTMLLVEYAWSSDRMSDNAKKLKAAMLGVWEHWQARQANVDSSNGEH